MKQYLDYLRHIRTSGNFKSDRTGTGTYSVFGYQMRFNLNEGFPAVTTKKLHLRSIYHELVWFLKGSTNIQYLKDNNVSIWNEWAMDYEARFNTLRAQHWSPELEKAYNWVQENTEIVRLIKIGQNCPRGWNVAPLGEDEEGTTVVECRHPDYWPKLFYALRTSGNVPAFLDIYKDVTMDLWERRYSYLSHWAPTSPPGLLAAGHFDSLATDKEKWAFLDRNQVAVTKAVLKAPDGDIGPGYGYQWRSWPTSDGKYIDQISQVIDTLKNNPDSRRIIVSAWNVGDIDKMALPACHCFFQFYVDDTPIEMAINQAMNRGSKEALKLYQAYRTDMVRMDNNEESFNAMWAEFEKVGVKRKRLSCQLYQRSCDSFLGVPFNIASYSLLTMMMAQVCDMELGDFIWTGGDCHIYKDHLDQVDLQLTRDPYPLPKMVLNPKVKDLFAFGIDDFKLEGYKHHPEIKGKVSV